MWITAGPDGNLWFTEDSGKTKWFKHAVLLHGRVPLNSA